MPKIPLSVTIIACNEEKNIAKAIQSVQWADDILVVDSGSTDQTVSIAQSLGARVIKNPWPGYGQQKNFAQAHATHDWVLNLDADEWVSKALAEEIKALLQSTYPVTAHTQLFRIPRRTYYLNQWVQHGGWYPNYIARLGDRRFSKWTEPHVHEALVLVGTEGKVADLKNPIEHNAFPSIHDQILTNLRFSRLGTDDLNRKGKKPSLLKLILKPVGKFIETYLLKGGFKDGLRGFIISVNAAHSIFLKYAFQFEKNLLEKASNANSDH